MDSVSMVLAPLGVAVLLSLKPPLIPVPDPTWIHTQDLVSSGETFPSLPRLEISHSFPSATIQSLASVWSYLPITYHFEQLP